MSLREYTLGGADHLQHELYYYRTVFTLVCVNLGFHNFNLKSLTRYCCNTGLKVLDEGIRGDQRKGETNILHKSIRGKSVLVYPPRKRGNPSGSKVVYLQSGEKFTAQRNCR